MAKYIDVTSENGEAKLTAVGFKGKECRAATAPFEKALGSVIRDTELPEMTQTTTQTQRQQLRPGGSS